MDILAADPQPISLECRIQQGPWQPCRMEVLDVGRHWWLDLGRRRLEFRHDGTGLVRMGEGNRWQEVSPHWEEGPSLCWDSVCIRGEIPLD